MNTTSTPRPVNKRCSNSLSQYVPDRLSLELAMERYCKIHWSSSSRRSSSEPLSSLVDSGRSSLTSYGSEESLSADELEVFSDCYSDYEDDEESSAGAFRKTSPCILRFTKNLFLLFADISLKQFDHLWAEWKIPVKDITIHRNHSVVDTKTRQTKMR